MTSCIGAEQRDQAGIVRADPTPPDVHIDLIPIGHGSTLQLDHRDNEVDDIVASIVDSNVNAITSVGGGIHNGINSIRVFIVNLIIFTTVFASRFLSGAQNRLLGVEHAHATRPGYCGSGQAVQ
ncbi:hypothetical protein ACGC1H_003446 [Rhizoctonia solani]|uniref:Uncharacterized protein n=1 Tax=Rhizoctonia solani TaxID=456999 RepID=A0A8H3B611_9AGAM|nr:unnamed protein product [Rhizoctonia solani]